MTDGRTLVGAGRPAALFDAASGAPRPARVPSEEANSSFSPDLRLLAISRNASKTVEVRDAATGALLWQTKGRSARTNWSDSGVLAVADIRASNDRRLTLWNSKTRRVLPLPPSHDVFSFSLHPTQPWVAVVEVKLPKSPKGAVQSSVLRVWNYQTQREVWHRTMDRQIFPRWSPSGRSLSVIEDGSSDLDATIWVFDDAGEVRLRSYQDAFGVLGWSNDEKHLAMTGTNQVKIVDIE